MAIISSSRPRPPNPWGGLLAIAASQLIVLVALAIYILAFPQNANFLNHPGGDFLISFLGYVAAIIAVILLLKPASATAAFEKLSLLKGPNKSIATDLIIGATLAAAAIFAPKIIEFALATGKPPVLPSQNSSSHGEFWFAGKLLIAALFEEVVLRGYLFKTFRKTFNLWISTIILVMVGFVLHLGNMMSAAHIFVAICLLQIFTCLRFERTENLWNPLILHLAYNLVVIFAVFAGI